MGNSSAPTADEEIFRALARANRLTAHEEYVVRELFHAMGLGNPVTLFVCPQVYDEYLERHRGVRAVIARKARDKIFA